jgi:cytochrome c peroxidase
VTSPVRTALQVGCLFAALCIGGRVQGAPADFSEFSPNPFPAVPPDRSNRWADDPRAAALGQRLFFDPRFSGPLLSPEHDGSIFGSGLGMKGTPGKVSCASCHNPAAAFTDTRSTKQQVSLGAAWTHRRSPSLLDAGYNKVLMWDGRRDTGYGQVLGALEASAEMNGSRLFAAQQMGRLYRSEYEAVFGEPFPDLSAFPVLDQRDAGCHELQATPTTVCPKPHDERVTRVAVNFGKAISAYVRTLTCGASRFDAWVNGDAAALTAQEQRGAALFTGKARCATCHTGPQFTDQRYHNVGLPPAIVSLIIRVGDDRGAATGLPAVLTDPLNVRGAFSDGDDGRLDPFSGMDFSRLEGAFRTPGLRCAERRPSFMHTGQLRTLEDVVGFFNRGGSPASLVGKSELQPLGLTRDEEADLVAFLRTLTGPGPAARLLTAPPLP